MSRSNTVTKPRPLLDHVPKQEPKPELHLLQARIDVELFELVQAQKHKDGLDWRDIVEAGFRRYLDETAAKKG